MQFLGAIVALLMLAGTVNAENADAIAKGKRLVEASCAACHGVGASDRSHDAQAPELRKLYKRYPMDDLEDAFDQGLFSEHPDTPDFEPTKEQIGQVVAYIRSIQEEPTSTAP